MQPYAPPPGSAAAPAYDPSNPIPNLGDAITWPFRDPAWLGKVVVMGLVILLFSIIPIIGWVVLLPMVVLGWTLSSLDNLRQGRLEIAPAGFPFSRGARLWVVLLCWYLVIWIAGGVLTGIGGGLSNLNSAGGASLGGLFTAVGGLILYGGGLVLTLIYPAIVVSTERGGIGAGLNPPGVFELVRANLGNTLIAGLFIWITGLIAALGLILCLIGIIFTAAWAAAANAGILRWYESQLPAQPVGTAPPAYPAQF